MLMWRTLVPEKGDEKIFREGNRFVVGEAMCYAMEVDDVDVITKDERRQPNGTMANKRQAKPWRVAIPAMGLSCLAEIISMETKL